MPANSNINLKGISSFYTKESNSNWKCKCGVVRQQKPKSGYSNLLSHLNTQHPDWKTQVTQQMSSSSCTNFFASKKAVNIHSWIQWKIMENREYEFVEKEFTRKYSSLESITVSTLQKYIAKLTQLVETEIKLSLPTKFGIVFDGWTNNYTHYV